MSKPTRNTNQFRTTLVPTFPHIKKRQMLTKEQIDNIKDIVIIHLDQTEERSIPEKKIYGLCEYKSFKPILNEILIPLENEGYIVRSVQLFGSATLTQLGSKIKREGGWKKHLQEIETENLKQKKWENDQIENLKWNTKLSKIQVKWFKLSLFVGFIGGLCGLVALFLQIKESYLPVENPDKNKKTEVITQPIFHENASDSLVTNVIDSLKK